MTTLKRLIKQIVLDQFWAVKGLFLQNPPLPEDIQSIMFVCKGNICRSPFAEHLCRKLYEAREGMIFGSAGLSVHSTSPAPQEAKLAAREFGVELSNHLSIPLTSGLMERYQAIFAMEAWQFRQLQNVYPMHRKKIYLLPIVPTDLNYRPNNYEKYNIKDPFSRSINEFKYCYLEIQRCVRAVVEFPAGLVHASVTAEGK